MVIFQEDRIKKEDHAVVVQKGTPVKINCVVSKRKCKMQYIKRNNTTTYLIKTVASFVSLFDDSHLGPIHNQFKISLKAIYIKETNR